MLRTRLISEIRAVAAVFILGSASIAAHAASLVLNGNFNQIGPNGNPVVFPGPGQQSGWTAAADWYQVKVVPSGYLWTQVEPINFGLDHQLHVRTNFGPWPPASMGNGFAQSFRRSDCTVASFWIR